MLFRFSWGKREDIGWAKRLDVAAELSSEVKLLFVKQAEEAAVREAMDKVKQAEEEWEDWEGRAGAALGSALHFSSFFSILLFALEDFWTNESEVFSQLNKQLFDRTSKKMATWCRFDPEDYALPPNSGTE
eukprot:scaffold7554_cov108-Skeletonema_marinoi.AAC.1